ncbi:MAG: hypothetical protein IJA60_07935 [Clostridia bacterium]|nr:hypothetical protein [Clostridia bacterium]
MKVEKLISEVQGGFEGDFMPPTDYLYTEYNMLIESLYLALPTPDASAVIMPEGNMLATTLFPSQIRRVFAGEYELLRASLSLIELLPNAKLYCPVEGGIRVNGTSECTVYYRTLPCTVTEQDADAEIPLDERYLPLVRAWMLHRAYLYLGDFECADSYGTEYNRLLDDYKKENGVVEC